MGSTWGVRLGFKSPGIIVLIIRIDPLNSFKFGMFNYKKIFEGNIDR